MARQSAGILLYRWRENQLEVFLIHMGGPYWQNKDKHAWSIPKGEFSEEEDPLTAAQREFFEETGFRIESDFQPLKPIKQSGGKIVHAWAVEGDCDASAIQSNTYAVEWPPKSGKWQQYPEAEKAEWFTIEEAKGKIVKGQVALLEELENIRKSRSKDEHEV